MFKKYAKSFLEREIREKEEGDEMIGPTREELQAQKPTYYKMPERPMAPPQEEEPETVIGQSISIKGEICFTSLLRIDGNFEGTLNSNGKLIVGKTGFVKSDICLSEAFISGKVEGDIEVKGRLVLRGRAEIVGNIKAGKLSVDEGAIINGMVQITGLVESEKEVEV